MGEAETPLTTTAERKGPPATARAPAGRLESQRASQERGRRAERKGGPKTALLQKPAGLRGASGTDGAAAHQGFLPTSASDVTSITTPGNAGRRAPPQHAAIGLTDGKGRSGLVSTGMGRQGESRESHGCSTKACPERAVKMVSASIAVTSFVCFAGFMHSDEAKPAKNTPACPPRIHLGTQQSIPSLYNRQNE